MTAVSAQEIIGAQGGCGWFEGDDPRRTRELLKRLKWGLTVFFLALGLLTLAAYMKIGYEHRARAGERYVPHSRIRALPGYVLSDRLCLSTLVFPGRAWEQEDKVTEV